MGREMIEQGTRGDRSLQGSEDNWRMLDAQVSSSIEYMSSSTSLVIQSCINCSQQILVIIRNRSLLGY